MELTYEKKYSLNIRDASCHMSSVYIIDVTAGSPPKMIVECTSWARQASEISELKKGHVYHITAGTFAPGQEGAFWIAVAGHGLSIEPLPFKYLTLPSDSPLLQEMQANYDPYPCCAKCHNEIEGSYFNTARGPQCPECNKGSPPQKKIRDPPPGTPSAEALAALNTSAKDLCHLHHGAKNVQSLGRQTVGSARQTMASAPANHTLQACSEVKVPSHRDHKQVSNDTPRGVDSTASPPSHSWTEVSPRVEEVPLSGSQECLCVRVLDLSLVHTYKNCLYTPTQHCIT